MLQYESLSQSSIETMHKRRNGIKSLLVCLSEYLPLYCVYILHDGNLGIWFTKKCGIALKHKGPSCPIRIEMAKLSKYMSKSQKVRMDYSRNDTQRRK